MNYLYELDIIYTSDMLILFHRVTGVGHGMPLPKAIPQNRSLGNRRGGPGRDQATRCVRPRLGRGHCAMCEESIGVIPLPGLVFGVGLANDVQPASERFRVRQRPTRSFAPPRSIGPCTYLPRRLTNRHALQSLRRDDLTFIACSTFVCLLIQNKMPSVSREHVLPFKAGIDLVAHRPHGAESGYHQ